MARFVYLGFKNLHKITRLPHGKVCIPWFLKPTKDNKFARGQGFIPRFSKQNISSFDYAS